MTGRELFGVVLRVAGLILVVYGLWNLCYGLVGLVGMPASKDIQLVWYFVTGVPAFLIGLYFRRGAPQILRFSYPSRGQGSNGKDA